MRLPSPRFLVPFIAVPALALGALGCGRDDAPDLINGKTKFIQKCASCHVLARANASGVQGPNLDQAFGPSRTEGFGEKTVEGVVQEQIALVRRRSVMPPNLVEGADSRDVAAYVAAVAGPARQGHRRAGQRRRTGRLQQGREREGRPAE